MKKWMYLIAPTVMLGAFMFLYLAESKEAEIKEKARAAEIAMTKALQAEKKKNAEAKAR